MASESMGKPLPALLYRRGVRQFLKYCVVGASCFVIDFGIYLALIEGLRLQQYVGSLALARPLAQTVAFVCAVTNGFIWHSRWTFRVDAGGAANRYAKFFLTNVIGLGLNLLVLTAVAHVAPPLLVGMLKGYLVDPAGFLGKIAATAVAMGWNFTASKYWTFKN